MYSWRWNTIGDKEVSFGINKYHKPLLLNRRDSIVQVIMNALFLKPGNLPNLPKIGVDIDQYIYKSEDELSDVKVVEDLRTAVGAFISGARIKNAVFSVVTKGNIPSFVLIVNIEYYIDKTNDTLVLGVVKRNDIVKYNFKFMEGAV